MISSVTAGMLPLSNGFSMRRTSMLVIPGRTSILVIPECFCRGSSSFMKVLILISLLLLNIPFVWAQSTREYLQNGNESFKHGDFDRAILEYTKAIDANPNLARAYNNRGV